MTSDDLKRAMRLLRTIAQRQERLMEQRERLADEEHAAIADALRLGAHQLDVAAAVKRSREHIRRVAAARGVPSRYPPRKKPDTPAE